MDALGGAVVSTYTIRYTDGSPSETHDEYTDACQAVLDHCGGDAVYSDPDPRGRTLIWATEEDATNDDGARAVASITEVQS
jgi:hypothetical protein